MMPEVKQEQSVRTLTVCSRWGLANRLRALISGMALAEATGRQFTMLWPRAPDCAALFPELFANSFPVLDDDLPPGTPILGLYLHGQEWQDFMASDTRDLVILTPTWIVRSDLYPAHRRLEQRCVDLLATLQPIPALQQRIDSFRAQHFRSKMIGVHLRRGDFSQIESRDNLSRAIWRVEEFLRQRPDAGIFLCTDDGAPHPHTGQPTRPEGVRQTFQRRFGDRVVWAEPRSLDRREPIAVQDALVELWLLRLTDYVVGTRYSSFSDLAVFGRNIPYYLTISAGPRYHARQALMTISGVYPMLKLLGYIEFRRDLPISHLSGYYRGRLRRTLRAVRRRLGLRAS